MKRGDIEETVKRIVAEEFDKIKLNEIIASLSNKELNEQYIRPKGTW